MPDFDRYVRERLGSLPLRPEREAEIVEEIVLHIKSAFEESRRRGMTEEDALASAEEAFLPWGAFREQILSSERTLGSEAARMEQKVDDFFIDRQRERGGRLVDLASGLWHDLRFALRSIRLLPSFSIPAIFTLALAIGATTAIFSFVNGIVLRPLDFESPEQLVALQFVAGDTAATEAYSAMDARDRRHTRYNISYPSFEYWRRNTTDILEGIAAYDDTWEYTVGFSDGAERLPGAWVSANLFPLLRIQPVIGRAFTDEEDVPGAPPVVIISHRLWRRKFAGDQEITGRILQVNEQPYTIVGVMPAGFGFPSPEIDFWRPMSGASQGLNSINYEVVGRLNPGITLKRADAQISSRAFTRLGDGGIEERWAGGLLSLHDYIVGDVRRLMLVFLAAVTAVLLIACVNVVNLMLSQSIGREKEYVVRAALGAGRKRLVQQMLTESTLISLVSGITGLGLAVILTRVMLVLSPGSLPRQEMVGIDLNVLIFTFTLALVVGVCVGLLPAVRASGTDLAAGLNAAARGSSGSVRHNRMSHALVVVQLGMAVILLVSAGLLLRSFSAMLARERGFDPKDILAFETSLPRSRYQTFEDHLLFYNELLAGVRAMPGVSTAAIAVYLPATGWFHSWDFEPPGYVPTPGEELFAELKEVSPGYFRTLGIRLIEGRLFDDRDNLVTAPPVIINEEMVLRYWPDRDAVGSTLILDPLGSEPRPTTVVGVVDDVMLRGGGRVRGDEENLQIYVPFAAWGQSRQMDVIVGTVVNPYELFPQIRRLVASIDAEVVLFGTGTIEDLLSARVAEPRYRMLLLGVFGLVALILAVIGVYGVMAFAVTQRTREMGICMALGAHGGRIMKDVFKRGLVLTLLGLGLGLAGSWVTTTLLRNYLYEIGVHDTATIILSLLILAVSALLACTLPALRAARVDPMIALRME